jgi:hypothetical protein
MKDRLRAKSKMDPVLYDQFSTGRLFACVASRCAPPPLPQAGRSTG